MILGSLTMLTLIIVSWRPYSYFPIVVQLASCTSMLEYIKLLAFMPNNNDIPVDHIFRIPNNDLFNKNKLNEHVNRKVYLNEHIISIGDTLSSILIQYGISIMDIMTLSWQYPALRHLQVGQSLSWTLTSTGNLKHLTWKLSHQDIRTYDRINRGFKENISNINRWQNTVILHGQLNGSFVNSARAAGLTMSDINAVITVLQRQIDFRKLRKGDQFSVLALRDIRNDSKMKSQLLGIRLYTGSKNYYAFRADNGKFYNQDAFSLAHSFMRFPIMQKYRISSKFNLNRLHPITKRIIPHRGIDLAVPIGTPVLAVGDGEVVVRKTDNVAGNYVTIRHNRQYVTRYMHLKKLLVQPGQKVKRGERIALSGNTGRSTGPHLHFEVWINQKAVNPLTVQLSLKDELTGIDRIKYLETVKRILPNLQFN